MMDCLPDEIIAGNILPRLPVKSVLQCRCVCKSWCSLITTRNFISTHLRNKTENTAIFFQQLYVKTDRLFFLFENNEDKILPVSLSITHRQFQTSIGVIGSIHGLICISINNRYDRVVDLILFNLSIGHFMSISPPPPEITPEPKSFPRHRGWTTKAFGFDEVTQDYKILFLLSGWGGLIYSLNSNSWRRLINSPVPKSFRSSTNVFLKGRFHWLAGPISLDSRYRFIMVFDVKHETFSQIPFPPECCPGSIFILKESVALVQLIRGALTRTLWVMKEYGSVESSWIKLAELPLGLRYDSYVLQSRLLGFRNTDEMLIELPHCLGGRRTEEGTSRKSGYIVSQNINKEVQEVKHLMDMGKYGSIFSRVYEYVPSLILLDKQNNTDAALDVDFHVTPLVMPKIGHTHQVEVVVHRKEEQLGLRRSKRARKPSA